MSSIVDNILDSLKDTNLSYRSTFVSVDSYGKNIVTYRFMLPFENYQNFDINFIKSKIQRFTTFDFRLLKIYKSFLALNYTDVLAVNSEYFIDFTFSFNK